MSGELTAKLRLVRCPKCRLLLPEFPHYIVYKCGGCGTTLQAKKRKNEAANPESCSETDAAPTDAVNHVSEDKECSNREQPVLQEKVLRIKSSSSSGECSLDEDGRCSQNGNGECNGKQAVLPQENVERTERTSSSSGECSLDANSGRDHIENGECDEKQLALPQQNVLRTNTNSSSTGECSLDVNVGRDQNENHECDEKHIALSQKNALRTKSTSSYSVEYPLDVDSGNDHNENGEFSGKQPVLPQEKVWRRKPTSSSPGECSLDVKGEEGVQIGNEECNRKKLFLPQGSHIQAKATSFSSGECSSDENGSRGHINNGECNGEQQDLPHENIHRTKSSSFSSGECSLDESGGRDQNENEEFNVAYNLSDEDLENEMDTNKLSDIRFKQRNISNNGYSTELIETKIEVSSVLMGKSSVEETTDIHLQLAEAEGSDNRSLLLKEAEKQLIGASNGVDASVDKSAHIEAKSEMEIRSDETAKSLTNDNFASGEGSKSGNPVSSSDKQMKQTHELKHHTFDTSEVMNQSSEPSGDLGRLSKSPTSRSSLAYDGSVSSYDGMDKQFPGQHLNPSENTYSVGNVVSEGRHRKGKSPINSVNVPSDLPRGKHHVLKDTKRSQYKVLGTTRHDPVRHWMRAGTEKYPPIMPFHQSGSQSGYESDILLNQMPDDEQYFSSSSFLSRDHCEDSDLEKMKLLGMIYKLQNQLNRTSSLREETNGRLSAGVSYKGKRVSASHSHDFREGRRFSHDLGDPWCDVRCSHGPINWRQRSKFSKIPFSAEATSSTHHVDNSCFYCRHQEWRYPEELPPHVLYQHEGLYRYHPGHSSCCFSHRSYPSRTQRYMGSKLQLYGRETQSDNQRHRAHEMRMYFREKQNLAKRHFRPVAGGAPFVTCPNCFNLLQLPADFLLFKRVCHQLKCGHCSGILKFSLQDRSHIVSYEPRELDDQSEVINGSITMASSASHANHLHSSHAVPISYSDDYGNYVSKSYSSEEPVSLTPFHPLHGSEYDTNVSRGNFEEEEKIAPRHSRTRKAPLGRYESTGVSSNMSGSEKLSPEMEAPPPTRRNSPLHQLMGYSSPSQVIRGLRSSGEDNELMKNERHD